MENKGKASSRIKFELMTNEVDVFELADTIMYGDPVMVNFNEYDDIESNKIISFLSGVTYAIDGEIQQVAKKVFLFASKKDFKDGSLRKFVKKYQLRES